MDDHAFARDVEIRFGLPPELRRQAAGLFFEAFHWQLRAFLPTAELAEELLYDDLDPERVFIAISGGRCVGFAGMSFGGRNYCTFARRDFVTRFGWIGGPLRFMLYSTGMRTRPPGELIVDGLGVTETARGQGIGGRLLTAVCDFAHANGYQAVRLDVADTNMSARRLYERCGFVAVRARRLPRVVARATGYSADIEMRRELT